MTHHRPTRSTTVPRLTIYYIDAATGKFLQSTDGREWKLPVVGSTLGLAGIGRWRVTGTRRIDDTHWDVVVMKMEGGS